MVRTLSVKELVKTLKRYPQEYKVYLSGDAEGNYFGTIDSCMSISLNSDDEVITLYPFDEHLDQDEIEPLLMARIDREYEMERLAKEGKL